MKGSWKSIDFIRNTLSFLFVFNFIVTQVFAAPSRHLCRPEQRDVLINFKNEFKIYKPCHYPRFPKMEGFLKMEGFPKTESWTDNSDCCSWDGVTCDTNFGYVIELNLNNSCITGELNSRSNIFRLQSLRLLNLSYNDFYGQILSSFGNLSNLTTLDLSKNNFDGQIPFSLGNFSNLTTLDLSRNNFDGQIPFSLGNLSNLTILKFSGNNFDGQIPSSLGNLSNLTTLSLYSNNFSGQIPFSLGNLSKLTTLNLFSNNFSGQIPFSLGNLSKLTTLNLFSNNFNGQIPFSLGNLSKLTTLNLFSNNFSGQIPSSLANISKLTTLNLFSNNFNGQIPFSLGNLSKLTILSLDSNNFSGQIPSSLAKLSHLNSLGLSANDLTGEIPSDFGRLNKLVQLNLDSNKLNGNFPFIPLLNLTGLSDLSFSNNQLTGMLPPNMSSLSNLKSCRINDNAFTGTLPSSLFTIPSLGFFDVSENQLNGTLEFGNISSSLEILHLGKNNFRGPISRSMVNLVNLKELDLSYLNTQGAVDLSIFSHFKSLRYLFLSHLKTTTTFDLNEIFSYFKYLCLLDLSGNHVSADIKVSISDPPLWQLDLSRCGLTNFPDFIKNQHEMVSLDISNNEIKGQVPGWLWSLLNLEYVDLYSNKFIGFEKPTNPRRASTQEPQMRSLDISKNEIKGQVPGWLWSLPNLTHVDLSSNKFIGFEKPTNPRLTSTQEPQMMYLFGFNNNFTGKIPYFICGLPFLNTLDLSNNKFSGSIPRCLGNLTLEVLNLKKNHLSGGLPENLSKSLVSLDIGHNQLVGKLPRSLVHISSLEILNVESNKFSDTFPLWLRFLQKLQVLVLRSNAFHGPIQKVGFSQLRIIDISGNHFNGTLPFDCFVNWTAMFSLGIAEDESNGEYIGRRYMGNKYYSDSMVLMNKGTEMKMERILKIFTAVDFSGNKFEGEIPSSIGLLKELHVLNLSKNAFGGHIPSTMANLIELESLDVSHNKLSGEIPQELGKLSFLSYMDFSHNQLVGPIPEGTQFQTQNCSSFEENLGLFGPTLDRACRVKHKKTSQQSEMGEEGEDEEEVISWIAVAIGVIPGIPFGFTIGYISNKSKWFVKTFGRNRR